MFPTGAVMSNTHSTSLSEEAVSTVSSLTRVQDFGPLINPLMEISPISDPSTHQHLDHKLKKKRNLPGNPDPDAEVIALSPKTLMATNRFVCEICNKGFQRDQNLQLHRRGHNLPWKLKQRNNKEMIKKKAYVCPEPTCVHHLPSRALGDLTGIKKHFCRKHGEKKWKCEKCSKIYAVQSDWKAHAKTCGTREYRCDCGTLFSRKDSFITHRAFCDALAEESARLSAAAAAAAASNPIILTSPPPPPPSSNPNHNISQSSFSTINNIDHDQLQSNPPPLFPNNFFSPHDHHIKYSLLPNWDPPQNPNPNPNPTHINNIHTCSNMIKTETVHHHDLPPPPPPPLSSPFNYQEPPPPPSSATTAPAALTHKNFSTPLHVSSTPAEAAHMSATALLQRAAAVGAQPVGHVPSAMMMAMGGEMSAGGHGSSSTAGISMGFASTWQKSDRLTRDFLGLTGGVGGEIHHDVDVDANVRRRRNLLTFTRGVEFPTYDRDHSHPHGLGFAEQPPPPPPPPPSETMGELLKLRFSYPLGGYNW